MERINMETIIKRVGVGLFVILFSGLVVLGIAHLLILYTTIILWCIAIVSFLVACYGIGKLILEPNSIWEERNASMEP